MRMKYFGPLILLGVWLAGCSTLPPGSDYPKTRSVASVSAQETAVGRQFAAAAQEHGGRSAFHVISVGVDGFLIRLEMINGAQRTLDLQYYIFHGDESGRVVTDALARAADRGVRVRVLVDDGETEPGDEQLLTLAAHANVEIRVFNPWAYRGHNRALRGMEFLLKHSRLDYRMHNKLLVADNATALVGGRNIGDQYFQIDPQSQFADDDVFAAGPVAAALETKFDDFWNSLLAIPTAALYSEKSLAHLESRLKRKPARAEKARQAGFDYAGKLASGEPLAGIISGQTPLAWSHAIVACDSPEKREVVEGSSIGSLLYEPVAQALAAAQTEVLVVSPYLVPTKGELRLLEDRRKQAVRVAILTNSLRSAPDLVAQAGYMHYRVPLLQDGVELYEVRSQLESVRGSGQSKRIARYGNYALHGKLLVFDRSTLFVGSMNFDARSRHLNTEIGLILDSPELSQQVAARFQAMTRPESAYEVVLQSDPNGGRAPHLAWRTRESNRPVEYSVEPARSAWQRVEVRFMSLLPLDREL
jgi:cardiolipin synthase C